VKPIPILAGAFVTLFVILVVCCDGLTPPDYSKDIDNGEGGTLKVLPTPEPYPFDKVLGEGVEEMEVHQQDGQNFFYINGHWHRLVERSPSVSIQGFEDYAFDKGERDTTQNAMTDPETIANLNAQLKAAVATSESLSATIQLQSARIKQLEDKITAMQSPPPHDHTD
jgi:hypothetical protein